MNAYEWFFFAGLAIGYGSSKLFVPWVQHDARGVVMLISLATALSGGWMLGALGVSVQIALPTVVIATIVIAGMVARRARRPIPDRQRHRARHIDANHRVSNS